MITFAVSYKEHLEAFWKMLWMLHLRDDFGDQTCSYFLLCNPLSKKVFTTYSQWVYDYSQIITIQLHSYITCIKIYTKQKH